ncbi:hypothetical protein MMC30_002672 [Trapelia coarctata]|nr:hypothetical protein [Trapelia coarctata]
MSNSNPPTNPPSRLSTPGPSSSTPTSRFTTQASTAEDLLKSQTVGLVHLSDFRKRRAEALEQKEREATGGSLGRFTPGSRSGAATPNSDGARTPQHPLKKNRKTAAKGKLSFGLDDGDSEPSAKASTPTPETPSAPPSAIPSPTPSPAPDSDDNPCRRRLGPSPSLLPPKLTTKSALLREAQMRESLRKEFLTLQDAVKASEILIPFVFYDGTNIPGGACRVKKGDPIWVFLDRSRKVGAELGVSGVGGEKAATRREWARVGVDDLMLVRGEVIIPHHYDFYYFIVNKTLGPTSLPLFDYASTPSTSSPAPTTTPVDLSTYDPLSRPSPKRSSGALTPLDSRLEGYNDDPNLTKVVDRRWYERNKHIFPASVWEEFDKGKDYTRGMRRDAEGNAFFFS